MSTSYRKSFEPVLRRLQRSSKALAVPVTYMILFVSMTAIITLTYTLAVSRISARGTILKDSIAKQNMQLLDDAVRSVAWNPGASEVIYMDNSGGTLQTQPVAKILVLNVTDEQSFSAVVFNSPVGKAFCKLQPSTSADEGMFIRGDERTIANLTSSSVTQIYFASENGGMIVLCYRPFASITPSGAVNGKPLTTVWINIVNLNSSRTLWLRESFHLRVEALEVATSAFRFEFNSSLSSILVKSTCDGRSDAVWLPVQSGPEGAVVDVELLVANIRIETVSG